MTRITRRRFLQGASAGAAAAGAVVAGARLTGSSSGSRTAVARTTTGAAAAGAGATASRSGSATTEPVVAYVRDRSKGEIVVFVGARQIIHHDPELAARLYDLT